MSGSKAGPGDVINDEGRRLLREYRKAKFTFDSIDKNAGIAHANASIKMYEAAKRLADHLAFEPSEKKS